MSSTQTQLCTSTNQINDLQQQVHQQLAYHVYKLCIVATLSLQPQQVACLIGLNEGYIGQCCCGGGAQSEASAKHARFAAGDSWAMWLV